MHFSVRSRQTELKMIGVFLNWKETVDEWVQWVSKAYSDIGYTAFHGSYSSSSVPSEMFWVGREMRF